MFLPFANQLIKPIACSKLAHMLKSYGSEISRLDFLREITLRLRNQRM